MRHIAISLASLGLALASVPVAAQEGDKWIVIGQDAAAHLQSGLATRLVNGRPAFVVLQSNQDRTIANLNGVTPRELTQNIHPVFPRCGGYTVHDSREEAIAELNNPFYASNAALKVQFPKIIDQQAHVEPALAMVDKQEIVDTIRVLAALGTRYYQSEQGQNAAMLIEERWKTYGANRPDFSVERVSHAWKQNSVVATIKGSSQPEEIVIVGAHLDSINPGDLNDAPGADDDASGIAVVDEVLRVLTQRQFKPRRTLQFMAYAAEEVGLLGSREIAKRYASEGKKVAAVLQVDMTGFPGSEKNMYLIGDEQYVNKDLTDFLRSLIVTYNGPGQHEITHGDTECGYGCSDHVSWTGVGVPSAFPFESTFADYNKSIHSPLDVIEKMDGTGAHQARFAKLALEYMIEIGKSAEYSGN